MLADMAMNTEAARHLVYAAAARAERGVKNMGLIASASKCFASDTAMSVTTDAVQLFGGAGYTVDFPVERMMRDAKITQIYEGTNQIQRMVMARSLLQEVTRSGYSSRSVRVASLAGRKGPPERSGPRPRSVRGLPMQWYLKVLKQYADFSGRARRTEFWMFTLFSAIASIVLGLIDTLIGTSTMVATGSAVFYSPGLLQGIYALGVLIPTLAVTVRRLHDTDRTGWWLLIGAHPDRRRHRPAGVHVPRGHPRPQPARHGPEAGRHGRRPPQGGYSQQQAPGYPQQGGSPQQQGYQGQP